MKTLFTLLAISTFSLRAGVVFDSSPPNDNSADIVNARLAASFNFTGPTTINQITFWYQAQFETDLSNVAYAFYNDASGALGTELASGSVSSLMMAPNSNAFLVAFGIPDLALDSGNYWLELHAGTSLTDDHGGFTVWWAASDQSPTHTALMDSGTNLPATPINVAGFQQYAFELDGTGAGGGSSVPEPATALLAGFALIAIALARSLNLRRMPRPS